MRFSWRKSCVLIFALFFGCSFIFPRVCGDLDDTEDVQISLEQEDLDDSHSWASERRTLNLPTPIENSSQTKFLLILSLLDGQLVALDAGESGAERWSLQTDSQPLLATTLTDIEMMYSDGRYYRLIPSLDGNLYMYHDVGLLKAMPLSVESLLSSSLRFGQDVIAGGKRISSYSLDPNTGELHSSCSMDNCQKATDAMFNRDDLLVRRVTQTVRAIDAYTGIEKWNVTVGDHQLILNQAPIHDTYYGSSESGHAQLEMEQSFWRQFEGIRFRIDPPSGSVAAVDASDPNLVHWTKQLSAPVAQAWELREGRLKELSLFDPQVVPESIPNGAQVSLKETHTMGFGSPIYMGTYKQKLYILPSPGERRKLKELQLATAAAHLGIDYSAHSHKEADPNALVPRDSERLYVPSLDSGEYVLGGTGDTCFADCPTCSTSEVHALITRQQDNSHDAGWYLYKHPSKSGLQPRSKRWLWEDKTEGGGGRQRLSDTFLATWITWWSTGMLCLMTGIWAVIGTRVWNHWRRRTITVSRHTSVFQDDSLTKEEEELAGTVRIRRSTTADTGFGSQTPRPEMVSVTSQASFPDTPPVEEPYTSRYLSDFDAVKCLGRGGFGVVFESRNKLDDCHYAVKRICVTNSQLIKEKMMREVKALAMLDHPGIVRYFQAWQEAPPVGWQQRTDKQLLQRCACWASTNGATSNDLEQSPSPVRAPSPSTKRELDFSLADGDDSFIHSADFRMNTEVPNAVRPVSGVSLEIVFAPSDDEAPSSPKDPVPTVDKELQTSGNRRSGKKKSKLYLYIQMQLCQERTLRDWLRDNVIWESRDRVGMLDWFGQIVAAVEYVHDCGLIHRDLKPSNIFFAMNGSIKIGDFGLATAILDEDESQLENAPTKKGGNYTDCVGTQLYMSPEQLSGQSYSHKVDIYSLGLILTELLIPFETQMERVRTLQELRDSKLPEKFGQELAEERDLISSLVDSNPEARPDCRTIRSWSLLTDLPSNPSGIVAGRTWRDSEASGSEESSI